MYVCMM